MNNNILYSIVASPLHKNYSAVYQKLGLKSLVFTSVRKAIQQLKTLAPDYIVADFIYGFGNNYAGVNISNLDVFLYSLQKQAPNAKVVVFVEKAEREYVEKLEELFDIHKVFIYPIQAEDLELALS